MGKNFLKDTRHFGKWDTCACKYSIFQNALQDFRLWKCNSKYTKKNLKGFYKQKHILGGGRGFAILCQHIFHNTSLVRGFLFLFAIPKCIKIIAKICIKQTFVFYDQLMIKAKFKLLLEIRKFRITFIILFLFYPILEWPLKIF